MEDEWYSGNTDQNPTSRVVGASMPPAGSGGGRNQATMGTFGDSLTPPASHERMAFGVGGPQMAYNGEVGGLRGGVTGIPDGGMGGGTSGFGFSLTDDEDYDNEPPLLEELGINFEHIWSKTSAVILPTKRIDINYLDDTDLAGPLVFCLCFGLCLLLTGKPHFGYIYGFGIFGCAATTMVLNLMGDKPINLWKTASVLGYCLLPVIGLAALGIVHSLQGPAGHVLGLVSVFWCTIAATRLFEEYLDMRRQRYLVAYPVGLLYACFVLITVY